MATLRKKRKLAAVARETQKEHPRNGQSRNTSIPRINQEHIKHIFEEIEGEVTKKLSQEFIRTESRILGALSKLDKFLFNPQIRTHSRTVPGKFRNTDVENQEPNKDRSQDDPHPEVGPAVCQSHHSIDSDPDEAPHMVTGVQEGIRYRPHMVTGVQEEIRYRPHMVKEKSSRRESLSSSLSDIPYCSPGISSEKQKEERFTSQAQFRSEKTPATIEQIRLALH